MSIEREPMFSNRRLGIASLAAVLGCAVTCSLPLIAAAGLGTGALATLSSFLFPGSEFVIGGVLFLGAMSVMALKKRATPSGCGGSCGSSSSDDAPLVCTLDGRDHELRSKEFREAFTHLVRTEPLPLGFRWHFRSAPGLEAQLRDLARREHDCCRFFEFQISAKGDELVWDARSREDARPIIDELMRLPETLKAEPQLGALKKTMTSAGLAFTSDK